MVRIYLLQKNIRIVWRFGFFFLPLLHRSEARGEFSSSDSAGAEGGLIYEKDVFERLSL